MDHVPGGFVAAGNPVVAPDGDVAVSVGLDADEVIKYLNYELGLTAAE